MDCNNHVTKIEPMDGRYVGTCSCGKWKVGPFSNRNVLVSAAYVHRAANGAAFDDINAAKCPEKTGVPGMDRGRLKVLRELPYRILPTCGLCHHSSFGPTGQWGTCGIHTYEHGKHTGDARQLSINVSGTCPSFQMSEESFALLEVFAELY